MKSKEELIQMIIDYNFKNDGYTVEGALRFLPKRVLKYGYLYGWDEPEVQHRIFLYMLNIKGFKHYLKGEK